MAVRNPHYHWKNSLLKIFFCCICARITQSASGWFRWKGPTKCETVYCSPERNSRVNSNWGIMLHIFIIVNNCVAMEVRCPRHPGTSTIGSQLQDGDCIYGWQNLGIQPWAPHAPKKTGSRHSDTQWKAEGGEGRKQKKLLNALCIVLL